MKNTLVKMFSSLIIVLCFAFALKAQTISINGSIEKKSVKAGQVGSGTIILSIPHNLHINSNKPLDEFLIPTLVKLSGSHVNNFRIKYPKGENKKFEFSEKLINVYEGKQLIKFTFRVPKNLKRKNISIKAVVSYQACTNEVCYPPKKDEIILKATVL